MRLMTKTEEKELSIVRGFCGIINMHTMSCRSN